MQSLSSAAPWVDESGENILCFDEFMLRSVKTLNVLQGSPMQPLSSAPPWGREVVKKHCVLMTLC